MQQQQKKPALPSYIERNRRNGKLSFRVYSGGPRTPLPNDPATPEFRFAYTAALVDAIAAEKDERIPLKERAAYAAEIAAVRMLGVAAKRDEHISRRSRGR